jgi:hypothetical protein
MGHSRERVTNIFHLTVDFLVAGVTIIKVAGVLVAGHVVERGASILSARWCRDTTLGSRRGSTETEPRSAED